MDVSDILRLNGLKKTEQRLAIMEVLQRSSEPLTENEIREAAPADCDRITLYRTLQTLIKADIVHRITVDNIAVKYALSVGQKGSHVHFLCECCGRVICLDENTSNIVSLPPGFLQNECEVLVKGICDQCRLRKSKSGPSE